MKQPIFITGLSRSGTTFLYDLVNNAAEFESVKNQKKEKNVLFNFLNSKTRFSISVPQLIKRMIDKIDEFYTESYGNKDGRWIDGSGNNWRYMDDIIKYFPGAKILFIQRHPMETVYSELQKQKYVQEENAFIKKFALEWKTMTKSFKRFSGAGYSENVLAIRHEDFINDPKEYAKRCFRFLGLEVSRIEFGLKNLFNIVSRSTTGIDSLACGEIDEYQRYFKAGRERVASDLGVCCKVMDVVEEEMNFFGYDKFSLEGIDYDIETNLYKLKNGTPFLIFGAGEHAVKIIRYLEKYNLKPEYIIDNKHGRNTGLLGLRIKSATVPIPIDHLIIPASYSRKFQMVWQLIEQQAIPKDNILLSLVGKV